MWVYQASFCTQKEVEYSYLKGRKGFLRICLEEKKDIVPAYTFRLNWMYRTPRSLRGFRARLSQRIFVPRGSLFVAFGWLSEAQRGDLR